jgi:ribosomal protein L31
VLQSSEAGWAWGSRSRVVVELSGVRAALATSLQAATGTLGTKNEIHDCQTRLGHGQLHSQNAPPKRTRTCALTDTAGNTSTTTSTVPAGNTLTVDVDTKGKGCFEGKGLDKGKGSKSKGSDKGKSKGSTRKGSDGCKSKGALGRGKGNTCEGEDDDDEPIVFRYGF